MKYFKKLTGDRVYLSPMNIEDLEIFTKWFNDKEIGSNLGQINHVVNLMSEKAWVEDTLKNNKLNFSIIKKDDDTLLGNCGIMNIDHIHQTGELGIFIGEKENRGKGYGTEAIKLLLDYSFNYQNLHSIMLHVYSYNENAIKVYKKIGFKEVGALRESRYLNNKRYDTLIMDILKTEFNK